MPITPFHFGPGAALHALAPRQVSFLAFCGANVLVDLEPAYYMLVDAYPLHRFFHTYVGASCIVAATVALFALALRLASRVKLPDVLGWKQLRFRPVAVGAALGSYSHIVLDSVMHDDIRPLAPFSAANPLLRLLSLDALHGLCVAAGVAALLLMGMRQLRQRWP